MATHAHMPKQAMLAEIGKLSGTDLEAVLRAIRKMRPAASTPQPAKPALTFTTPGGTQLMASSVPLSGGWYLSRKLTSFVGTGRRHAKKSGTWAASLPKGVKVYWRVG